MSKHNRNSKSQDDSRQWPTGCLSRCHISCCWNLWCEDSPQKFYFRCTPRPAQSFYYVLLCRFISTCTFKVSKSHLKLCSNTISHLISLTPVDVPSSRYAKECMVWRKKLSWHMINCMLIFPTLDMSHLITHLVFGITLPNPSCSHWPLMMLESNQQNLKSTSTTQWMHHRSM